MLGTMVQNTDKIYPHALVFALLVIIVRLVPFLPLKSCVVTLQDTVFLGDYALFLCNLDIIPLVETNLHGQVKPLHRSAGLQMVASPIGAQVVGTGVKSGKVTHFAPDHVREGSTVHREVYHR